nr:hypothetical protein [Tanacetum cinerariifolium]
VLMIVLVMHIVKNDMVIHTEKMGMMRLVVEIDYDGKIADVLDKVTWSFDGLQPEQVDWKVTIQPIQGRQNSLTAGMTRQYISGPSGTNSGKQRVIVCYNCKGEGHMSKQCTKPKRKRDEAWFKDKNSSFPTQQDDLILSVIEQLKNQVVNCTKINQDNKNVNEILTAELERYKDQVKSSHWQYNFPLPVKVVATARRLEMPLPEVCTAIKEKKKKLPVKDRWQLH